LARAARSGRGRKRRRRSPALFFVSMHFASATSRAVRAELHAGDRWLAMPTPQTADSGCHSSRAFGPPAKSRQTTTVSTSCQPIRRQKKALDPTSLLDTRGVHCLRLRCPSEHCLPGPRSTRPKAVQASDQGLVIFITEPQKDIE
jgi:hypothetical protein